MKKSTLSEILKVLMFKKNIKTARLARELNIPQQTLQRIVTGASAHPHLSSLRPIANYFGISLAQLKGDEALADDLLSTDFPGSKLGVRNIPLVDWGDLTLDFDAKNFSKSNTIFIDESLGADCFSLKMNDMSMEPYFPQGSTLIFDPDKRPKDRSFVLVVISETRTAVFRQVLVDGDYRYLKPLNPDLNTFSMRILKKDDIIIAGLVECRHVYKDL